jgi:hypothetical protein
MRESHQMSKRATAIVEESDMSTSTTVPPQAMAQRRRLAGLIRARMAKPATAEEKELWLELQAEIEKERLTFRS